MKLLSKIERINLLHQLILNENTHAPSVLAKRLNISVSRLYAIIDELKAMGAPILYCRNKGTYYYSYPYQISITVFFKALNTFDQQTINGGSITRVVYQNDKSTMKHYLM